MTVFDLLTSRAGYGFPSDFTLPAVQRLFPVQQDGPEPQRFPPPDAWMAELAQVPMLYQPGEAWLYDSCSVTQGVLISRVSGQSLPEFLAERIFQPLGRVDGGFYVAAGKLERFTSYYRTGRAYGLELADGPEGQWSTAPPFPLGNGGLVGTADDWLAFGRMLLAGGTTLPGRRLLSADSVQLMINNHTTNEQRMICTVAILLTQVAAESPVLPEWMRAFWRYAAMIELAGQAISKINWPRATSSLVPCHGALSTKIVPSSASTRSVRPTRPEPPSVAAPPIRSSS
jgi:CubicO group peptidase (beta-lactamase class C family)